MKYISRDYRVVLLAVIQIISDLTVVFGWAREVTGGSMVNTTAKI